MQSLAIRTLSLSISLSISLLLEKSRSPLRSFFKLWNNREIAFAQQSDEYPQSGSVCACGDHQRKERHGDEEGDGVDRAFRYANAHERTFLRFTHYPRHGSSAAGDSSPATTHTHCFLASLLDSLPRPRTSFLHQANVKAHLLHCDRLYSVQSVWRARESRDD